MTDTQISSKDIVLTAASAELEGTLSTSPTAEGLVVFAHGSGSSRFSPRNRQVATYLNERGLATLLFDLLTAEENRIDEATRELRFDIELLRQRLTGAIDWCRNQLPLQRFGLFGASTGAAAALMSAADRPDDVAAVVSRGGRPDLAGDALPRVRAATLLIVGGRDTQVIELNQGAAKQLQCLHETAIVPGASHLFEEPGTLEEVCRLAGDWFLRHLSPHSQ